MSLWMIFFLAFVAGFVTMWMITIEDDDTDFIIFESDEELQRGCWEGLRKGLE